MNKQAEFVAATRAKAKRMRFRAASELRTVARMAIDDAEVLERGQPVLGGHREGREKASATACDYLAAALILDELCDDIEAMDLISRPVGE
jgi:hypothetical protein